MANVTVIPARRRRMQTDEAQKIPKIKVAAPDVRVKRVKAKR